MHCTTDWSSMFRDYDSMKMFEIVDCPIQRKPKAASLAAGRRSYMLLFAPAVHIISKDAG